MAETVTAGGAAGGSAAAGAGMAGRSVPGASAADGAAAMGGASPRAGKVALVLEGGSFRGQFTAGVLDVFLEQGVEFDVCYGVSAGTLNALNFKARQIGRANRINLAFRDDKRYMSMRNVGLTGNIVGYDFLFDTIQNEIDPFDAEAYRANPMPFFATVTDLMFGTADYLELADPERDLKLAQASTALPMVSQPVEIGRHLYLDGGLADSVPVEEALERRGYGRAVVVLTQHRAYEKGAYDMLPAARQHYSGYPYFVEALATRHTRYNEQRRHIWEYEREGRAFVLAPEEPVDVASLERDGEKLLALYVKGRQAATAQLADLRAFMAGACVQA